ncbi:LysR family transcriptional regulator [Tatumella citrea]|uniref:LysR family transcriptional regulator n=1 Tax=Tatumella citrea TaxID=53336 RepID=A0A1Y0L7N0_TATCI|nr:LysR family transcriptional regulator [Tatumella citrea]ARU94023.1 LysR family transcriptional regulator [Tatumella citrea]ARU98061.1 LysR family transcriptional regulator [Tatumella citrea]
MQRTTLEQWAILDCVVATGSFARAALQLHRSQSSVSYNLSQLQEQLGVTLLVADGRRSVLTTAGSALLLQMRPLLKAFGYVEALAATMHDGQRTQLNMVVDAICPRGLLYRALNQFRERWPHLQIQLTEILEGSTQEITAFNDADIQIVTARQNLTGRGEWLMNVDFIAVARYDHPLFANTEPLTEALLSRWPRIQIADGQQAAATAGHAWNFSTVDAAAGAIIAGLGYGWLPRTHIGKQLAEGELKPLPLSHGAHRMTPLHVILRQDLAPPDEPVSFLLSALKQTLPDEQQGIDETL